MEKIRIFSILGIEETNDMDKLKMAYRNKLVNVNPEDNPEGFKELRTAYEEAISLASKTESSGDEKEPVTPIEKWIARIKEIYLDMESRLNEDIWSTLLSDNVCIELDTCDEAIEQFIVFLMDHFRLPKNIWSLIEEKLSILSIKDKLYERFPSNFVDFLEYSIQNEGWMDYYNLLEGKKDADYDAFINDYLEIRAYNDGKTYEKMENALSNIMAYGVYHPYLDVERLRYMIYNKKFDEAKALETKLRAKYVDDIYVHYYLSDALWEMGDYEASYEDTKIILEKQPKHFAANKRKSDYLFYKENYTEAKELYLDLLEQDPGNESVLQGLEKANEKIIDCYNRSIAKNEGGKELKLELCWCLFQNGKHEEAINIMNGIEVDKSIYFDYHNLKGRTYLIMEKYEEALPHLEIWLDEILKIKDDGSKEVYKKIRRLSFAYYAIFNCHFHIGIKDKNNIDKERLNKSLEYIDKAIEAEKNKEDVLEYKSKKAILFLKVGENEKCVDLCDEIIRDQKTYYPAYVYRQEAYFNLRRSQEVIDDYYNAIDLYTGYEKPYVLAAKVFYIYNQYEDCLNIINKAKEASVDSLELKFIEIKAVRRKDRSRENNLEAIEHFKKLYEEASKDAKDMEDISLIIHEMAVCYIDMNDNNNALKTIKEKLKLKYSEGSLKLKGDILYNLGKYKDALKIYNEILSENPDYDGLMVDVGDCYYAMGDMDKAIEYYGKAEDINPDNIYANNKLGEIYRNIYNENKNKKSYDLSVKYIKRVAELKSDSYTYNELGRIYLRGYELEKAKDAFRRAIEEDSENMYSYNNLGYAYQLSEEYEKAYEYYQKSVELGKDKDMLPYWNIAANFTILRDFENAIKTYKYIYERLNNDEKSEKRESIHDKIASIYCKMGEYEKAIEEYGKILDMSKEKHNKIDALVDMADAFACLGNSKMALKMYKKAIWFDTTISKSYERRGYYYLHMAGNLKKAENIYKKAYNIAIMNNRDCRSPAEELLYISYCNKNIGKMNKYFKVIIDDINKNYGSVDEWLSDKEHAKARYYNIIKAYYYIGDYNMVEKYFNQMNIANKCKYCKTRNCHELYCVMGLMAEAKGNYMEALKNYERALEIVCNEFEYVHKVKEMKEKIREMRI